MGRLIFAIKLFFFRCFLIVLFFYLVNKCIEIEKCYHKNLTDHADEENEVGISCRRSESGEGKHKETGEEEVRSLLLDSNNDTYEHKGNNGTKGEDAANCFCPSGSCVCACVANDFANLSYLKVCCF